MNLKTYSFFRLYHHKIIHQNFNVTELSIKQKFGYFIVIIEEKKYAFRFVYLFKKKSCLLFCCQSSFSFCDILFYVGTEVKNPEHYTKKILKLTKKNSHWFYSSRKARNLKKNDLSPPKFTLKRKLHTEKSQIKP